MHMCYERPSLVTALNGGVGYDKWDRDRGGGGGGGGGGTGAGGGSGAWAGRDRERDRERERQARAHQMSQAQAPEQDASSLFPAPIRVTGNRDRVSQQIQTKLGDYHLAQCFIDDPSKSIGICAEPPSPAPCPPSRRESEFKKPAHAPQNGVRHHRPHIPHNKNDGSGSTGAPHRPPPLRIPNGIQSQNSIDSSQPPIESILKEMKSLPTPLSVIAATPRKELENNFIFNPYTIKVQENPQLANKDLKTPLSKPGLDNRISNSRSSVSPDVVSKDLGLSESDDEVANSHAIGPPLSPICSGSPSSGSSSPSEDSETETSSAESSAPAPPPPPPAPAPAAPPPSAAPPPAQVSSWGLRNFVPLTRLPPDQTYDSGKELSHALADVTEKPSPISELSDSEASSPSPGAVRRRRSIPNRVSTASSDEDTPTRHTTSPRVAASAPSAPQKRGRPPKARPSEERPPKKRRGRPPKPRAASPPAHSEPEPEPDPPAPPPPAHHHALQDTKSQIFRRVFTPKKSDECGGKGGKGGKGKGGKGKGQVTIIELAAPESGADDDERRHRERSGERRGEDALAARLSPPPRDEPPPPTRARREPERAARRRSPDRADRADRPPYDRIPADRTQERTSNDRMSADRTSDRSASDRSADRLSTDRLSGGLSSDRLVDRLSSERLADKMARDRLPSDKSHERSSHDRLSGEKHSHDRLPDAKLSARMSDGKTSIDRLSERNTSVDRLSDNKISVDRLTDNKAAVDRLTDSKMSVDRLTDSKMSVDRLSDSKMSEDRLTDSKSSIDRLLDGKITVDRLTDSKMSIDRLSENKVKVEKGSERFVRAEADVGSGLKPGRGSERLEEASSNVTERRRVRLAVRIPLSRLRAETVRALQRPPRRKPPQHTHAPHADQAGEVAATNHERTDPYPGQTPIYFSYFERLPADTQSDEERDHRYYLEEATRLRAAAEREQDEPLPRVMLYLESVLCFVLTGRVLELELDTKGAFTVYRETIEYIKSIHSMPQRFRASPHDTFNKLDILSLRVQALLYLRMFKMYNREVKEYNKIVHEYQQKLMCTQPALAESVSPLSPTPSPAGSVGSVGSGSASSGYCSLAHSVPAHAHQALLLLNKYYAFLYVAHDLWEQADSLCRLRANRDLFIAVDRKCGPLSLSSTFRHLVQYVRHAISLLKNAPRE